MGKLCTRFTNILKAFTPAVPPSARLAAFRKLGAAFLKQRALAVGGSQPVFANTLLLTPSVETLQTPQCPSP